MDLPLAKAAEKVLGSMHVILQKTKMARDEDLAGLDPLEGLEGEVEEGSGGDEKQRRVKLKLLRMAKAAEVRVVRNLGDLREPDVVARAEGFEG